MSKSMVREAFVTSVAVSYTHLTMPWWEQVGGDVDDLIFADEEYEISAR